MLENSENNELTNHDVLGEVDWCINHVCNSVPSRYREDIRQDIVLQILIDLEDMQESTFNEKVDFCLSKISNYRRFFKKRYENPRELPLEDFDAAYEDERNGYSLSLDIEKIWPYLTKKQKYLLVYLIENGVDTTYKEIGDVMGYNNASSSMWALRVLFQKINSILNGKYDGKYDHKKRYRRYKKT